MKKYFAALIILFVVIILAQCQYGGQSNPPVDSSTDTTSSFKPVINRLAEIQKCASCHPAVYENWMKGPHANAYKAIQAHIALVDTSDNFSEAYHRYLYKEADLSERCYACHTGANVFETNFGGLAEEKDPARFTEEFYPNMLKSVFKRDPRYPENMHTGVDCLSCHKSGDKVVTHGDFVKSDADPVEGQCEVVASPFFSTNQSCRSCHIVQVRSMKRLVAEGLLAKELACTGGCHQEYDTHGKGTHYFFWRHEAEGKTRPKDHNVFQNLITEVDKQNGEWNFHFVWGNNYIPHDFSAVGEAVVLAEVWSKDGVKLITHTERANLRDEWIERDTVESLRDGISGIHFLLSESPVTLDLPINGDPRGGTIRVRGLVKPQYWSKDGELEEVFSRETPISDK